MACVSSQTQSGRPCRSEHVAGAESGVEAGLGCAFDTRAQRLLGARRFAASYSRVVALTRLRGRMPVIVFVLLVVVCLALIGVACACFGDTPLQALDRAFAAAPSVAAVIELWPLLVALSLAGGLVCARSRLIGPPGRASPALLQRFLF